MWRTRSIRRWGESSAMPLMVGVAGVDVNVAAPAVWVRGVVVVVVRRLMKMSWAEMLSRGR